MNMMILPAIDLKEGRCVRLAQGRMASVKVYDQDPVAVAQTFAAGGAEMIHVVDLDGAFAGRESANRAIVKKIIDTVNLPVEFGGGVRTVGDVEQLLELGVAQVILGTLALESNATLSLLVKRFGSRITVGIDAFEGEVKTRGWKQGTNARAIDFACAVAGVGVERLIYTDIARDGMLTGPNIEQTCEIARASQVRVTASGGISSLDDLRRLQDADEPLVDSVIIGKALYEGRFTLKEAVKIGSGDRDPISAKSF
jgi:phosphoribosylformimino-5-aminoimidazole carboxamide ribotide isomerase